MIKLLNYLGILTIVFIFFSCDEKNEWTPEMEKKYKEVFKENLSSIQGKGIFTVDQINYIADCTVEKLKAKGIKPLDTEKPENITFLKQYSNDCNEKWISKSGGYSKLANTWDSEKEDNYKNVLKEYLLQKGGKAEDASFIADCFIMKMKEQNIGPADMQDPKNNDLIQKINMTCKQELMKKK